MIPHPLFPIIFICLCPSLILPFVSASTTQHCDFSQFLAKVRRASSFLVARMFPPPPSRCVPLLALLLVGWFLRASVGFCCRSAWCSFKDVGVFYFSTLGSLFGIVSGDGFELCGRGPSDGVGGGCKLLGFFWSLVCFLLLAFCWVFFTVLWGSISLLCVCCIWTLSCKFVC